MPILFCADSVGLADGREEVFYESVYLLNEDYTVVGQRLASNLNAGMPAIGECFFDYFKASTNSFRAGPSAKGLYTGTTSPAVFTYQHFCVSPAISTLTAKPT